MFSNFLYKIKNAYKGTFDGPDAEIVLADLKRFCYIDKATFTPDDPHGRISAFKEGRREVFMYIQKKCKLTDEDINNLKEEYDV